MATKRFPLNVVLTVTTGRLLTTRKGPRDNGIGDLHELLGWMTNDQPFTHQFGQFGNECKPWLLRWFPELDHAERQLPKLDEMLKMFDAEIACSSWLGGFKNILPAHYDVPRIPADDHTRKDAVQELTEMIGPDKVIVVTT